jgi:hypothetical protein
LLLELHTAQTLPLRAEHAQALTDKRTGAGHGLCL